MQIRQSTCSSPYPQCPFDHEDHAGCLDRHGFYERYADTCGDQKVRIQRFYCRLVGRTLSVLPDHMLPYRAVSVPSVEEHFDHQCGNDRVVARATQNQRATKSEIEVGCLQRAWHRFTSPSRRLSLTDFFGQRLALTKTAADLWSTLRNTAGELTGILVELAREGKSLLRDYRCLRAD
jgi:hypothetical protein